MAQENFNVSLPNDGLGDALRAAFVKQQAMNTELYNNKVDKVTGKDLSTNDFTNALKAKLDGIENFAEVNVQADWLQTDVTADDYIKNKPNVSGLFPDGFTVADTELIDQDFIVNAAQWYVNSQLNILPFSFPPLTFAIPLAGVGLQRADLFYGTNVGTIERIEGVEAVVAVEPTLPVNSVRLTVILTDDASSSPPEPVDLTGFVQKIYFDYSKISLDVETLPTDGRTNFVIDTALATFKGFNGNSELFSGKRFIIRNESGADCALTAVVEIGVTLPFFETIVLEDGNSLEFDLFENALRTIGGVGGTIPTLQEVTENGNTTTENVTIEGSLTLGDSTYSYLETANGNIEDDGGEFIFTHENVISLNAPQNEVNGNTIVSIVLNGWNAATNTPALANTDTNKHGLEYPVSVAGTQDFGAGDITFGVDDIVANNGIIWYKKINNNQSGGGGSAEWIVISANKTAVNDEQYSNVADATYTDPSPVEGKGYVVKVVNGTATIGGVGYAEGNIVTRTFHSGSWRTKIYYDSSIVDLKQDKAVLQTTAFTAEFDKVYNCRGTFTITNPTGVLNKSYEVRVLGGAVTVGGEVYTDGSVIQVSFNGTTFVYNLLFVLGVDTEIIINKFSTLTLADYIALTTDSKTLYFTEEQNATGWQNLRSESNFTILTSETQLTFSDGVSDGDSSFSLIDLSDAKLKAINEKDYMFYRFQAGIVTPSGSNRWFKVLLKVDGVTIAVSPVFYLVESVGVVEQISYHFVIPASASLVTNGAYFYLKGSTNITAETPLVGSVRVHKSTNATE